MLGSSSKEGVRHRVPKVFVSIGANINKAENIRSALIALRKKFGQLIVSSIFESEAVGFEGDSFYNMVIGFDTAMSVTETAVTLRNIEFDHGRTRLCHKFSARTLDLDLILYGDLVSDRANLRLPREDILQYAFVLQPLAEIAPELVHPVTKKTYASLWSKFDRAKVHQQLIELSL